MREGAVLAWSGSEVLWWGGIPEGKRKPTDDGFAFDPVEGSWRELPPAPIPGAYGHALAAGEQVLLLHVSDEAEGLLFDPARDSWHVVPRSPHRPAWGGVSVWTGSELVVWGGG
ncbi:MAG: hypothetical protein M3P43_12975, partial [Actinomycetota bacterium]|nr:hypothetical protein [Actinomycetota bacterium]